MTSAGEVHQIWRTLPEGSLCDVIGGGTCLILAPHPDDESLGCGGLTAASVAAGRSPLVVVLTDGAGSHPNSRDFPPERLRAVRAQETRDAACCLGLSPDRVVSLGEPDTAVPHDGPGFDAVVARICSLIGDEPACTAVLAPWRHDPHCDHEAASLVADAVANAAGIRHVAYPVWGWMLPAHTPVPGLVAGGWRFNVEGFLTRKRRAIQAHRTQYGGVITDDPTGFQLPAGLLSVFDSPFEIFLTP